MDAIEIINSVSQFYNSAWEKLIFIISISIVIIGFCIPVVIAWWQKRSIKIAEDSLKDNLTKFITDDSLRNYEKLEENIDNKISGLQAISFHIQGNSQLKEKLYGSAISDFITAGYGYLQNKDFRNLYRVNRLLKNNMSKLTKEQLEEIEAEDQEPSNYIKRLVENDENGLLTDVIKDIKKEINKIKKQKKPAIKK